MARNLEHLTPAQLKAMLVNLTPDAAYYGEVKRRVEDHRLSMAENGVRDDIERLKSMVVALAQDIVRGELRDFLAEPDREYDRSTNDNSRKFIHFYTDAFVGRIMRAVQGGDYYGEQAEDRGDDD